MHSNKNKESVVLYDDFNVTINKTDDFNYSVRTRNGTYGFITCSEKRDELVVVVKKNKYETMGRFVHVKENPEQSIEDFIIEQTVSNIIYLVSKTHLHSIHKDFTPFLNDITAETFQHVVMEDADTFGFDGYPRYKVINEDHNYYANNCVYYYVLFTRKKVINNVFRYTQIFKNEDMKPLKKIHFYKAGDITLAFGSFEDFITSKQYSEFSMGRGSHKNHAYFYGVNGCLTQHVNSIRSWCDVKSIKVLKYKKYYVNVMFENGRHKLTYMENLNRDEFQMKKYHSTQPGVSPNEFIQEGYLTVTASIECDKISKISSYDLDEIKHFDNSIVSKVYNKKKKLALLYPSYQLKDTALHLGFNIEELNLDILDAIDMYTY